MGLHGGGHDPPGGLGVAEHDLVQEGLIGHRAHDRPSHIDVVERSDLLVHAHVVHAGGGRRVDLDVLVVLQLGQQLGRDPGGEIDLARLHQQRPLIGVGDGPQGHAAVGDVVEIPVIGIGYQHHFAVGVVGLERVDAGPGTLVRQVLERPLVLGGGVLFQ